MFYEYSNSLQEANNTSWVDLKRNSLSSTMRCVELKCFFSYSSSHRGAIQAKNWINEWTNLFMIQRHKKNFNFKLQVELFTRLAKISPLKTQLLYTQKQFFERIIFITLSHLWRRLNWIRNLVNRVLVFVFVAAYDVNASWSFYRTHHISLLLRKLLFNWSNFFPLSHFSLTYDRLLNISQVVGT